MRQLGGAGDKGGEAGAIKREKSVGGRWYKVISDTN